MHPALTQHRDALIALCRKHHVQTLDVFGSAATDQHRPDSDFDFLVTYQADLGTTTISRAYFGLLQDLEDLFGTPVDLVMERAIRNPHFREGVETTRRPLFAAA